MSVVGYAYPWDFDGDPAAASRAASLGCDVVAVAATYHASRTVSPLHPYRRVREVTTSASYVPVRPEAWRGRRLVPSAPHTEGNSTFASAASALAKVGLDVAAWVVVAHHDELGLSHPDLVVRNAFGERYSYALCPSSPEVVEYAATLVREVVDLTDVESIVLEACGPMGVDHTGVHEKTEFAHWDEVARDLLSICFCDACSRALDRRGVDPRELATRVRRGVDDGAPTIGAALGDELASEVWAVRREIGATLQSEVIDAALALRRELNVTLHTSARPLATGSFPELGSGVVERLAGVVANAWDTTTADGEIAALEAAPDRRCEVGAYLRLDRRSEPADATIDRYRAAGVTQWHLYHLGLLDRRSLDTARRVVNLATRTVAESDQ